jgi:hypothetical protein
MNRLPKNIFFRYNINKHLLIQNNKILRQIKTNHLIIQNNYYQMIDKKLLDINKNLIDINNRTTDRLGGIEGSILLAGGLIFTFNFLY